MDFPVVPQRGAKRVLGVTWAPELRDNTFAAKGEKP